jgi:voltage-gated potassium channel
MYFIAEGEVDIDLPAQRIRLGEGQFFRRSGCFEKNTALWKCATTKPTKLLI